MRNLFKNMKTKIRLRLFTAIFASSLLAGCASTQVTSQHQYLGFLPKPRLVVVYDFAVSPDEVELDAGIAELDELIKKTPRTEQERAIGRQVADALATHLVLEIQALGIPAVRGTTNHPAGDDYLLLKGQFISVDEGNLAEREIIGLGMGRTDVKTMTQLYGFVNGKKTLVDEFDVNSESGRKPGMAETMGVGALTGHLAVSAAVSSGAAVGSESFFANVSADASRAAKVIAKQMKQFYIDQGWIKP
jgi:hypothetical protein